MTLSKRAEMPTLPFCLRMSFGILAVLLASTPVYSIDLPRTERADMVVIEKPLHFVATDGSDVVAEQGNYRLLPLVGPTLQLKAEGQAPLFIDAMVSTHDQSLEAPHAISLPDPGQPDILHLVLLLPNGTTLDAVGTLTAVHARGGGLAPIPPQILQAATAPPPPIDVRDHRTPVGASFDFELAFYHAPIHYQDTNSSNYLADYITRVDYDGDWIATNNWDNLSRFPLTAHVYYSVVESCSHWYIIYAFFHPRDWTNMPSGSEHENDMEGFLSIVRKDGSRYGRLEGMVTSAHWDFYSYTPAESPLTRGRETIDGRVTMQVYEGSPRPLSNQEDKGHGVQAFPFAGDFTTGANGGDGIIYYPSRTRTQAPRSGNDRHVDYTLIDIFAPGGLWELQLQQARSAWSPNVGNQIQNPFYAWARFKGDQSGGCGRGTLVWCEENSPHPPWGWADRNDGMPGGGYLALDPIALVDRYFKGKGAFSREYLRNRYLTDLRNEGYRPGHVPKGWPIQEDTTGFSLPVELVNLNELFAKLSTMCH